MSYRATVAGYLGAKPEMRTANTPSGPVQVTTARVAVNRREKGQDLTEWVDVDLWGQSAKYAVDYLDKGAFVVCHGDQWIERYTHNGKDGAKLVLKSATIESPKQARSEQTLPNISMQQQVANTSQATSPHQAAMGQPVTVAAGAPANQWNNAPLVPDNSDIPF